MRFNRGGYTITEVMVVLAISSVLFTSAAVVFRGQQGKTVLSQNLYDIASKIESYASNVGSGVYEGSNNYTCDVAGVNARPVLTPSGSSTTGSNEKCLFLGKSIHVTSSTLYAYSVLGRRLDNTGSPVTSFDSASPEPALSGGSFVLTDQYVLPSTVTFSASKVSSQASPTSKSDAYMVGLYIDLSGVTNTGGSTSLIARGYTGMSSTASTQAQAKTCIEGSCAYIPARVWELCIKDGNDTGSVTVETTASGVVTRVNAAECL